MKKREPRISLTLSRLLLGRESGSELGDRTGRYLTGEVVEAGKAEANGLITILEYHGKNGTSAEHPGNDAPTFCVYTLTPRGKELAKSLGEGSLSVKSPTDAKLIELINYAEANDLEPDNNPRREATPVTKTHQLLASLFLSWVERAAPRLGLAEPPAIQIYRGDLDFGFVVAEVMTRYTDSRLRLRLLKGWYKDFRFPYSVTLELDVRGDSRAKFKKLAADYPGALEGMFRYAGIVRFECSVPYDNAPRKKTATLDHMKAYFASDNDDEEHFALSFEAYERTPAETTTKATTCLLSLHLSSGLPDASSMMLQHHLLIRGRQRAAQ